MSIKKLMIFITITMCFIVVVKGGETKYVLDSIWDYDNGFIHYSARTNYTYSYNGLLIAEERWSTNSSNGYYWDVKADSVVYEYDKNDSLVLKIYLDPGSSNTTNQNQYQYFRNEDGLLNSYIYKNLMGISGGGTYFWPSDSTSYEYDSNGLINSIFNYDQVYIKINYHWTYYWYLDRKYENNYNDSLYMVNKYLKDYNEWNDWYNYKYKWEYTYDTLNNQTNEETFKWTYNGTNMGWWEYWYKYDKSYDDNNNCIEKINYSWDNVNNEWYYPSRIVYVYDTNNNMIRQENYTSNQYNNTWELSGKKDYYYSLIETYNYDVIWDDTPINPMSIEIQSTTIDGTNLEIGDEIAIYCSDSINNLVCVGVSTIKSTITASNPLLIVVSENDTTTSVTDGFINGSEIVYKIWKNTAEVEFENITSVYNLSFDQVFTSSGTAEVTLTGHPHYEIVDLDNTYQPMSIFIDSALVNGINFEIGDEIGIFDVDGSGNELCVGTARINHEINPTTPLSIIVSADNPNTTPIDGFTSGNTIVYKAWMPGTQIEASIYQATYNSSYNNVFSNLDTVKVNLTFTSKVIQSIFLQSGWNIMSFNVTPDSTNLLYMMQPLVNSNSLIKVIDEQGGFIQDIPGFGWINSVGNMNNTEGYHIKVLNNSSLDVVGMSVISPFDISLSDGWNIMSYTNDAPINAISAMQPLVNTGKLVKVIDEKGGIIQEIPISGWLNTIGNFQAGEGYRTKVNTECTFQNSTDTPFILTKSLSSISQTSVICGGEITNIGGANIISNGVCWSTSPNPTLNNYFTIDLINNEIFESNVTNLLPNTQYYIRAYATNSQGTSYGSDSTFTTLSPVIPTIIGEYPTNITLTTATCRGTVISDGGAAVTARGVCWSTSQNPTINGDHTTTGEGTGQFEDSITGLSPGVQYYLRFYATNSIGISYNDGMQFIYFTTLTSAEVTTVSPSNITSTTALCGGDVANDGGTTVTSGVCWSTSSNPVNTDNHTIDKIGEGTFQSSLTNLSTSTQYFIRAYSSTSEGVFYGSEFDFTTLPPVVPTVTTDSASNLSEPSAISGGNVTTDGGLAITARGVCWSTTSNPTLSNDYTIDSSGMGSFISTITGTTLNTQYFVRAYATNSLGTAYGNEINFIAALPCSSPITYEGQDYNIVEIGTQCWMAGNLNVGTRVNAGSGQINNGTIEKWCYNNNEDSCSVYGGLYQWDEMMQYSTEELTQGICPPGWHLPNDTEYTILADLLGGKEVAGGKMKKTGYNDWHYPNTGATNESGFSAIATSNYYNGFWNNTNNSGIFWTSTYARFRSLYYLGSWLHWQDYPKAAGFPVRCIRD